VRVDLHVLVDGAMRVDSAHAVAEAVARAVQARVPAVIEVLVHLGPVQRHRAYHRPEQKSGEVR
jgi:divalent metal cation (Fe/Co/Zn/Cd) transporter